MVLSGSLGMLSLLVMTIGSRGPVQGRRTEQKPVQEAQSKLLVLIKPQPDAPLLIAGVTVEDGTDPRMPTTRFSVVNNTRKRIIAYAIRHDATLSQSSFPGAIAFNIPYRDRALRSGAYGPMEISGIQYAEPPINLVLSVDFVEFADGTKWGPDTFKHGEMFDGFRAGAKKAKAVLLEKLSANGPDVLVDSLDSLKVDPYRTNSHSSGWLKEFAHGVEWMRERVRSKGKDTFEIKKELRRSID